MAYFLFVSLSIPCSYPIFLVSLISVIHILRSQYSIGPRITMVRAQRTDHTLRVIFSTKNYSSNVSCTCCSGAELALKPRGTASYQQLFNGPRSKCHGEVSDHKSCQGDPPQKNEMEFKPSQTSDDLADPGVK